jgi:hypothetical protein
VLIAAIIVHRRSASGENVAVGNGRARPSDIAPITQPAALMSRVDIKGKPPQAESRSYRLEPSSSLKLLPAPSSALGSFDAIDAALGEAPLEPRPKNLAQPLDEIPAGSVRAVASAYAPLPPSLPAETTRVGVQPGLTQLLDYRDVSADDVAGHTGTDAAAAGLELDPTTVPRGTLIYVYLLTTVDTSNPAAVLQLGAARSLVFNHRLQLPFGTRFLGKLAGPPARDRLNLAMDTILFPDGAELPLSATAVEADESGGNVRPGVAAEYFPPPTWAQLAPYFSDFATGYLGLLESRAQRQFATGFGGAIVQASTPSDDARAPLYEASAQAIQDFTQARLKDISQRYASYYLIPAGSAFWLELNADLDLSAARGAYHGSRPSAYLP